MERVKSFFSGRAGRRSKPDCTAPLAAMRSPRPNPYEAWYRRSLAPEQHAWGSGSHCWCSISC